jgi:hypothetical protein
MSDFFDRVVARAQGAERTIQPLTPSRYAAPAPRVAGGEAPEPADAAPAPGSARVSRAPVPAPGPNERTPGEAPFQDAPALPPPAGARAGDANAVPSAGPEAAPSPRGGRAAVDSDAFDDDALVERRAPAPVVPPPAPAPAPVQAPTVAAQALPRPGPATDAGRPRARAADRKVTAAGGADAGPSDAPAAPGPTRVEPGSGSAQRARDLLADIYDGPSEPPATPEPPALTTLAPADWNGGGPREAGARPRPADDGPREITIAIDRIDVRGLAPAARPEQRARRGPRVTLDEYMRQHPNGRARR